MSQAITILAYMSRCALFSSLFKFTKLNSEDLIYLSSTKILDIYAEAASDKRFSVTIFLIFST